MHRFVGEKSDAQGNVCYSGSHGNRGYYGSLGNRGYSGSHGNPTLIADTISTVCPTTHQHERTIPSRKSMQRWFGMDGVVESNIPRRKTMWFVMDGAVERTIPSRKTMQRWFGMDGVVESNIPRRKTMWFVMDGAVERTIPCRKINIVVKLIVYIFSVFSFVASLLSLALISLERVFASVFPFRHRATPSNNYTIVFGFLWLLTMAVSLFFNFTPRSQFHAVFICYWAILTVSLATMIVSYTIIFIKVKLQDKRQVHAQHTISSMLRTQRLERNLAMTLFIVTFVSLLTWLPYLTVRVIFLMNYTSFDLSRSLPSMISIVFLIQCLNSLVNPVIYVYRMKDFRKAFFQLILRCSRDRASVPPIGPVAATEGDLTREMTLQS
ncbi:LOW QUALITY PROTEIN: cysteinyl leukotriene receptor 2-like [Actinia tenebrosa]|uniref:LOW QUALITY PROTEIN: cysteinyl leukotriene receptor 2-like n=1 Tax=Actinia tenebrosa TaxID=6105 RepID=A0A6P8I9Y8_ACTTE|nr:LOW QUALITY PROTEIN: cysteinyl leukotriene receptor 2-like [Actinia tenebrosa]